MSNITVQELAEELKVTKDSLLAFLTEQGFDDIQLTTTLEDDISEIVRDHKDDLEEVDESEVHLKPPFIVKNIAQALEVKAHKLVSEFMKMGVFAAINQSVDQAKVEEYLTSIGRKLVIEKREKSEQTIEIDHTAPENQTHKENLSDRTARPPVVAVLGHVDHGKTTLLDALRNSTVTAGEAGGITQHSGASAIERNGMKVTFLDTPGHAAFSAMRQRGADITDICLLLVAADDGVNAQTKEAYKNIVEACVPFIVVINKVDLPNADPDNTLKQLQQLGILTEDWGGEIGCCRVSAKTGEGLDGLVERIHLEAELNELTGNAKLPARASIIESQIETGLGATASAIVQDGTLKTGDTLLCGEFYGKVKSLLDFQGKKIKSAGPSTPVTIVGLSGAPEVGAIAVAMKKERDAKKISSERQDQLRQQKLNKPKITSVAELLSQVKEQEKKVLKIILKTDVRGTAEAIINELKLIESDKLNLEILTSAVGSISENDVLLAASGEAKIIGFHVRTNPGVNKAAKAKGIDIKLYSIIYELIDDVREIMTGMLDKEREEVIIAQAEILQTFLSRQGKICGSIVRKGKVKVSAHARVFRGEEMIYNGSIKTLRRFKDNVKEVANGVECGINLDNFDDFEIGDRIEVYDYKEVKAKL